MVKVWREDLSKINAKAAESLADPAQYPNLFPNLDLALHAETYQVHVLSAIVSMSYANAIGMLKGGLPLNHVGAHGRACSG